MKAFPNQTTLGRPRGSTWLPTVVAGSEVETRAAPIFLGGGALQCGSYGGLVSDSQPGERRDMGHL